MAEKVKIIVPSEVELGKTHEFRIEKVGGGTLPIPPDKTVLRGKTDYKVWLMRRGKKCWLITQEIFDKAGLDLGFTGADIKIVEPGWEYDPTMLSDIPQGKDIIEWPEKEEPEPEEDKIKMLYAFTGKNYSQFGGLGFNVFQDFGKSKETCKAHLNAAQSMGMRYLANLPDYAKEAEIKDRVEAYRGHLALYGYLAYDDADLNCSKGLCTPDDMRRSYENIKKYDEVHPVCASVCHGKNREDDSWVKYLAIDAFDVLFYEIYVFRTNIPDPWEWLKYMYDRLDHYSAALEGKRIIPIIPTFQRGMFTDPTGSIVRMYEYSKERLKDFFSLKEELKSYKKMYGFKD